MQLQPEKIDLDGIHLIEASAGTGKTYAITSLYLRLLLEKKLRPEQILVLTFTEAAVKELHERIRRRLVAALRFIEGRGGKEDDFLQSYIVPLVGDPSVRAILVDAERNFDLAAIYTIHGFCQRVLRECAIDSGALFEMETVRDDNDTLRQLVDDYWRLAADTWPDIVNNYLQSSGNHGLDADSLYREIVQIIPALRVHGQASLLSPPASVPATLDEKMAVLAAIWRRQRGNIITMLQGASLSRAKDRYNEKNVLLWASQLDCFFENYHSVSMPAQALEQFSADTLAASVIRGKEPPAHDFFNRLDELLADLAGYRQHIWNGAVAFCLERLSGRKQQDGICTFDDLLIRVRNGLRGKDSGDRLASYLRLKYPAALVDEFQDTDAVQYEIFESVYKEESRCSLFLVGDPKQAIYKFRGADIFTYMKAAGQTGNKYGLRKNYRSSAALVDGVNRLFCCHRRPFFFEAISFQPVGAALKESRLVIDDQNRPLTIWYFDEPVRATAKKRVAAAVAGEISSLLTAGLEGSARLSGRPLSAADIAVLVRSHGDGEIVTEALSAMGIASVATSRKSVYATLDAWELQLLLEAVEKSGSASRLRAALVTTLMGRSMGDLQALAKDEQDWEEIQGRFRHYRVLWEEHGFAAMLRGVLVGEQVEERVAGYRDGERRLTNIRHLLELLQDEFGRSGIGPAELISRLRKKRDESSASPGEDEELRLESDEHLVKVVTIHKSKGLEFPVVFCPFLWDSRFKSKPDRPFVFFHDREQTFRVDYQTTRRQEHHEIQLNEEMAEELRLLYVAATRARERCYITYGKVGGASRQPLAGSPLAYLLHPGDDGMPFSLNDRKAYFRKMGMDEFMAPLRHLAGTETVSIAPLPEEGTIFFSGADDHPLMPARAVSRQLRGDRNVRSFSSLQEYVAHGVEEPDYDSLARYDGNIGEGNETGGLLTFPRGRQAGSCLHLIMEELDFSDHADTAKIADVVRGNLRRFGFAEEYTNPLGRDLQEVLRTELGGGLTLAEISLDKRLNELEFFYTVPESRRDDMKGLFLQHMGGVGLNGADFHQSGAGRDYMKGYVDLIVEWQGRYYIIDYKSNYLGDRVEDYLPERLAPAMEEAGYRLQYYIYTVALHRYLQSRLAGYDYSSHFGGVYYLFMRGMSSSIKGGGVFFDRPEKKVIEALDRELRCRR